MQHPRGRPQLLRLQLLIEKAGLHHKPYCLHKLSHWYSVAQTLRHTKACSIRQHIPRLRAYLLEADQGALPGMYRV